MATLIEATETTRFRNDLRTSNNYIYYSLFRYRLLSEAMSREQ